jgi:hypothetical protein
MDLTPCEPFYCSKPSIQHVQPFGRECYIYAPYQKWKDGKKLSLRAQRAIFTRYNNTINHLRVFLPDTKKTIVSADIFLPPSKIEGALPLISRSTQHLSPLQTSLDYSYSNKGISSDNLTRQWMRENPQEANN